MPRERQKQRATGNALGLPRLLFELLNGALELGNLRIGLLNGVLLLLELTLLVHGQVTLPAGKKRLEAAVTKRKTRIETHGSFSSTSMASPLIG